jgi:hypothetical protein
MELHQLEPFPSVMSSGDMTDAAREYGYGNRLVAAHGEELETRSRTFSTEHRSCLSFTFPHYPDGF